MILLAKSSTVSNTEQKLAYVQKSIQKQINLIVDALITFYRLEEIRGERDLKRELLINLVTNFVLEGELYFLVYNLTSLTDEDKIQRLKKLMMSRAFLENCLEMGKLHISKEFQFDVNYRNKYQRIIVVGEESAGVSYCVKEPFS